MFVIVNISRILIVIGHSIEKKSKKEKMIKKIKFKNIKGLFDTIVHPLFSFSFSFPKCRYNTCLVY